ncbi:MAG: ABC transporter ATP-binding protein [Rhodovulum sulfidophilum]|uniref:ABC transporter ATP-binding protein n=1 Tax=Rhodovulum sulfidophilum TaxID=35806 RepID=A0A2W5NP81_RHOSU|nr:MAG: ABC transporter ATP-binding protein [Rhodovulum sulfidophilum]
MRTARISAPILEILGAYWRSDRAMLLLVAVIVVASSAAGIAAPYLFSRLIDQLGSAPVAGTLLLAFAGYGLLIGLSAALQRMVSHLSLMTAENLGFIASTRFFAQVIRKTPAFYAARNPAEIVAAGTKGQAGLTILVHLALLIFIPGGVQIALTLAMLGATIDPTITLLVLVYGAGFVALSWFANRRTKPLLNAAIAADQESARLVGNALQAIETLRHFGAESWARDRFSAEAGSIRDNWRGFALRHVGYATVFGLALAAQVALTFALILPRYEAGALSIGDVVLFNALLLQLNQPFEMIGQAIDDVARARGRLTPMTEIWLAPAEPDEPSAPPLALPEGRLVFEGVSYLHESGRGVAETSFAAERGRITFLTGETGSGKSTLLRLAAKSLAPRRGRILVDGVDLATIGRADWSRGAAVVPQDVTLLNESLETNILLGRPKDPGRLARAARAAAILDFVERLPEGFATTVGERGLRLSGGERQRIAIARALYGDPAILFLDEASSALDEATEREIITHLRGVMSEVTILAITHRTAVIAPGDQVVNLTPPAAG